MYSIVSSKEVQVYQKTNVITRSQHSTMLLYSKFDSAMIFQYCNVIFDIDFL